MDTVSPAATPLALDGHPASNRILGGLMASAMLGGLGQLIGLTVGALLIKDLLHTTTWIGIGNASMQIGTALGAWQLSRLMARTDHRRAGLVIGYAIGLVGGVMIGYGARWHSLPLALAGLVLFGVANTANQQARFAAADAVTDVRRARAVGIVVWSSTVGVVIGPKLSEPAGRLFRHLGFPELGGPFVVGGLVFILAGIVCWAVLRPDPMQIGRELRPVAVDAPKPIIDVRACLARPAVRLAIGSLVAGQVVMVGIMSITSVHLRGHGYTLGGVGTVISGHVLGMYGPAPISGWLVDRVGRLPVIAGGNLLMALSGLYAALARPESHGSMIAALFLLGLGWNANFVAGSTLVTDAVSAAERPRIQGIADSSTFFTSALAALFGGFGLSAAGYPKMAIATGCIAATTAVVVIAYRQAVPGPLRALPAT